MCSTHLITPETETSSHYFYNFARDFRLDDEAVTKILSDGSRVAFSEDLAVLEAQQRTLDGSPEAPRIDINSDNAPLQSRRILSQMIDGERLGAAAP